MATSWVVCDLIIHVSFLATKVKSKTFNVCMPDEKIRCTPSPPFYW
jgi:hypothetical protein